MTRAPLSAIKGALLSLLAPAKPWPDETAGWTQDDWRALDDMAQQHRLQPWLHDRLVRHGDWPIPPAIAASWKAAHDAAGIRALTAQAALLRLVDAFAANGVPVVALKGARLAFCDYPAPALRPMRDIDLLVTEADLPRALGAMAAAGCSVPDDRAAAIARALPGDKQLAPIWMPSCERYIELHHRISDRQLADGRFVPEIATADILSDAVVRTVAGRAIAYPCAEHMLGHMVVHAAYNHGFDVGPLALCDIALFVAANTIDSDRFAAMAQAGGWAPGAWLLFAIVEEHFGPLRFAYPRGAVPEDALCDGRALLLQNFGKRHAVKIAQDAAQGGGMLPAMAKRLAKGLGRKRTESRWQWLATRAARTAGQFSDKRARDEAAASLRLSKWLNGRD